MTSLWSEFTLADPPEDGRGIELWLQHLAGFIMMHDIREAGMEVADEGDGEARDLAMRAVDATLYALAQVFDGVLGGAQNERWAVALRGHVSLRRRGDTDGQVVVDLDLFKGDGVCTGIHSWWERDYGEIPLFTEVADDWVQRPEARR